MFEKIYFFKNFKTGKSQSNQDNHYENYDKILCSGKLLFYRVIIFMKIKIKSIEF